MQATAPIASQGFEGASPDPTGWDVGPASRPSGARREPADIAPGIALALLALALAVATGLRFYGAGDQLWYDEIRTLVGSVREPFATILTHFPSNNDHVLYSLLAHATIALGGESPFTVRLPAVLLGIVSVALIYLVGRRIASRFEALAAAILASVAAHHVWFSQNARGYTLILVLTLLALGLLLDGLQKRSYRAWLLFAVASALAAYTHLTMVLATVGQALALAVCMIATRRFSIEEAKGPALGFIGAAILTLVLYAPMLGDIATFFQDTSEGHKAASPVWAIIELLRNLSLGAQGAGILIVGGAIFLVGLVSYWRQAPLIPLLFFLPPLVVYLTAVLLDRPTFPRFFFFVAGFLLLVGIRGVFEINRFALARLGSGWLAWEKPVQWAAVAAMAGVLVLDLSRTYGRPKMDYAGALAYVERQQHPGDRVAAAGIGADYVYNIYHRRGWASVNSLAELTALRRQTDVIVVRTFERSMASGNAALLASIRGSCTLLYIAEGTLADGDLFVSRCARQA